MDIRYDNILHVKVQCAFRGSSNKDKSLYLQDSIKNQEWKFDIEKYIALFIIYVQH